MNLYRNFFKRTLDIVFSGVALLVLSIPLAAVTVWLHFANKGTGAFFFQERPGKDGKIFKVVKFKTMTDERDENGELLPDSVRLTKFGKLLRKTSLDELPELWNIFKGDMSLIGPRPLLVSYLPWYTEREKKRHSVRPGLTGLAQVSGRNFIEWDKRLEKDVEYVEHMSFLMDLRILWRTIAVVFAESDEVAEVTDDVEGNLAEIRAAKK